MRFVPICVHSSLSPFFFTNQVPERTKLIENPKRPGPAVTKCLERFGQYEERPHVPASRHFPTACCHMILVAVSVEARKGRLGQQFLLFAACVCVYAKKVYSGFAERTKQPSGTFFVHLLKEMCKHNSGSAVRCPDRRSRSRVGFYRSFFFISLLSLQTLLFICRSMSFRLCECYLGQKYAAQIMIV